MLKPVRKIAVHFAEHPKKLFLTDSAGAILSALFLFVLLRNFNEYIGMPESTLKYLSVVAVCLSIYSMVCINFLKGNARLFLRGIVILNLLYCMLTIACLMIAKIQTNRPH